MTRHASAEPPPVLVWFRSDLRVSDNPALHAAVATGQPLLCVYILDDDSPGVRPLGGAARWWLHGALADLAAELEALGGRLDLYRGAAAPILTGLADAAGVAACFWNRRYDACGRAVDVVVEASLESRGVAASSFNGSLLHEPGEVLSKAGTPFRVFTPFRTAALALGLRGAPLPAPRTLVRAEPPGTGAQRLELDALHLRPSSPDWAGGLRATWTPGERAAQERLHTFLSAGLQHYGQDRDRPAVPAMSRLSPSLRHGEISPRQVVAAARHAADSGSIAQGEFDKFVSEVLWRDFSYGLLAEHPRIDQIPMQPAFAQFPYRTPPAAECDAWRYGRTGYPIVDAGMRQLWTTGVMHNRVRMVTASFLVKHMLVDWRVGEEWFWDTLCDADPASNPVNWQWVAGCGVDAAPYFRIFNPVLQGETFDPHGDYVRTFVPELAALPPRWIHQPWAAPAGVLAEAGVALGRTYPQPIVEHRFARERARAALGTMRERAPGHGV